MKKIIFTLFIGVLLTMCARSNVGGPHGNVEAPRGSVQAQDLGDGLFARIATNRGDIVVRLEFERTPLTVTNFVGLAEGTLDASRGRRFYDGLTFHRVISRANGDAHDFMIQGGCPQGTGRGGPGYNFPCEIHPELRHGAGVLSMANAGRNTNGSQFFITIVPTPHLDGGHTVFGHVVQGQNVVNTIRQGDRIQSVTIVRNGDAANAFRAEQEDFNRLLAEIRAADASMLENRRQADISQIESMYPNASITPSGIRYIVEREGTGDSPAAGRMVSVHYKGSLLNGTVFDDSSLRGSPIEFPVGTGRVIQGWDETVMDMRVGERRTVIIPPELAYGDQSVGNGLIPPHSFLIFEMELVSVR